MNGCRPSPGGQNHRHRPGRTGNSGAGRAVAQCQHLPAVCRGQSQLAMTVTVVVAQLQLRFRPDGCRMQRRAGPDACRVGAPLSQHALVIQRVQLRQTVSVGIAGHRGTDVRLQQGIQPVGRAVAPHQLVDIGLVGRGGVEDDEVGIAVVLEVQQQHGATVAGIACQALFGGDRPEAAVEVVVEQLVGRIPVHHHDVQVAVMVGIEERTVAAVGLTVASACGLRHILPASGFGLAP
jgi:hypothetical protein